MTQLLTLRRAAKLRNRLQQKVDELASKVGNTSCVFNVADPDQLEQLSAKSEEYLSTLARYDAVSAVLVAVRTKLGQANINEVNGLLAEQAALRGRLVTLTPVASALTSTPTEEQFLARIQSERDRMKVVTDGYHRPPVIEISLLSKEVIESAKSTCQTILARIDEIQDRLDAHNTSTKIELSDTDVSVLKFEKLI